MGGFNVFNLGMQELILILVVVLIVFGPSKLPEIGRAFGKSMKEFKAATTEVKEELQQAVSLEEPKKDQNK